jgi:hypothetical protein
MAAAAIISAIATAFAGVKRRLGDLYDVVTWSLRLPCTRRVVFKAKRTCLTRHAVYCEAIQILQDAFHCDIDQAANLLCGPARWSSAMVWKLLRAAISHVEAEPARVEAPVTREALTLIGASVAKMSCMCAESIAANPDVFIRGFIPHTLVGIVFPMLMLNSVDRDGTSGLMHIMRSAPLDVDVSVYVDLASDKTRETGALVSCATGSQNIHALRAVLRHAYEDGSGVNLAQPDLEFFVTRAYSPVLTQMHAAIVERIAAREHYARNIRSVLSSHTPLPVPLLCLLIVYIGTKVIA